MPRLLVTGGSGYLGRVVAAMAAGWDVTATYLDHRPADGAPSVRHRRLDLRDAAATRQLVAEVAPTAVIHTACSNQAPQHVEAIVPAARNVAAAAGEVGARLVHVSSDMVFDGTAAPYDETAYPRPMSPYGQAKAEAEAIVAATCPDTAACPGAAIVRTSLILGLDPPDHGTRWLLGAVERGEQVTLFTDEIRCPIWVEDLAKALLALAAGRHAGVLNVAGPVAVDRWALGVAMLRHSGLTPPPNVAPGTMAASGLSRPTDLRLDIRLARSVLGPEFFAPRGPRTP